MGGATVAQSGAALLNKTADETLAVRAVAAESELLVLVGLCFGFDQFLAVDAGVG